MADYTLAPDAERDLDLLYCEGVERHGIEQADRYLAFLFDKICFACHFLPHLLFRGKCGLVRRVSCDRAVVKKPLIWGSSLPAVRQTARAVTASGLILSPDIIRDTYPEIDICV